MNYARGRAFLTFAVFAASFVAGLSEVQAAGFDCRYAKSHVEKLICTNTELSRLDSQLKDLFVKVQNETSGHDGETGALIDPIGDEQRQWRETVRDRCPDAGCLRKAYTARIRQVQEKWSEALQ